MKRCSGCKEMLDVDDFPWKSRAKGIRQARCKACYREYNRAYYAQGERTKQIPRVRSANQANRQRYLDWKAQQKCANCGESSTECLDLHHIDPSQKDAAVSTLTTRGWAVIQREIQKCIVLCANCHRKVHAGTITLTLP